MKSISRKTCAAACATLAMLAVGGLTSAGLVRAASVEDIYIYDGDTTCRFYKSNSDSYDRCDSGYGSYDPSSNTLTIGAQSKNKKITFSGISDKQYTIKATSNLETKLTTSADIKIIFDIGEYTWTIPDNAEGVTWQMPNKGSVTFKSGKYNIHRGTINADTLQINGGEINMFNKEVTENGEPTADMTNGQVKVKNLIINGGSLKLQNNELSVQNSAKINGGTINITDKFGLGGAFQIGLTSGGTLTISGGAVSIDVEGGAKSGIELSGSGTFTVSGGNLNISNATYGIFGDCGSKITFNGGTTTIKNSATRAISFDGMCEDPKDLTELEQYLSSVITLGTDIGIKESDLHIFLDNEISARGKTGVVTKDTLTIAKGYTNRKVVKGWEIAYTDPSDINKEKSEDKDLEIPNTSAGNEETKEKTTEKKSSVKSPDTGASTKDHGYLVAFLSALPLLAGIVAGTRYYIKTRKSIKLD